MVDTDRGHRGIRKLEFEEIVARRLSVGEAINATRHRVVGILEDVRSLYNVGSCFRSADAMLLEQIVLTGYTPTPHRPEIDKTALGATHSVPWMAERDTATVIDRLRAGGWQVFALEIAEGSLPIETLGDSDGPVAFVVGNELTGVRIETLAACDGAVEIPMLGAKHSLNVAVAFGIAAWEATRRRRHRR